MFYPVYFLLLASAFAISLFATGRSIGLAERWGFMDRPGERKVHSITKPRLGGLGIFSGFFATLILSVALAAFFPSDWFPAPISDFLDEHRAGLFKESQAFIGLVIGGLLIFAGGILDDRVTLSPRAKLVWEIAASLVAISLGYRLDFHEVFWKHPSGEYLFAIPATLFWFLFLINAFNLLDNMDGLSAGVAAITTTLFAVYSHCQGEYFLAAAMAILVGALLGFLRYNWNPSRVFMGDGGALLVGFLIAAFTCRCTYYQMSPGSVVDWFFRPDEAQARQGLLSILTPLVIMAVPIFDTTTVVLIRWRLGKPLMQGDQNHFSHRLVGLGLSHRAAVGVIYLVTFYVGLGALILRTATVTQALLVFLQVLSVFAMILLLERRLRRVVN